MKRKKNNGDYYWLKINYRDYYNECINFSNSLKALNLDGKICIIGFNAPGWVCAHMGTMINGQIPVGIYPSNKKDACEYIIRQCQPSVLVVQNKEQYDKFEDVLKDKDCSVKTIVFYGQKPKNNKMVYSWNQFIEIGKKVKRNIFNVNNNQIATIIYTSGTTGNPRRAAGDF